MDILDEMTMQVAQLNMWTKAYDEGHPMVSDKTWDEAYFRLLKFEQNTGIALVNSPTQRIDYQVVNALEKVTHNHPMLSAAKTKDWQEFITYFGNKEVTGMLKLDGLTGSLRYVNGRLVSAETRGNGEVGENVLHNALVIKNIPKRINYTDELIIDGEFIITDKDFEPFADEYANSRNLASGSIRLLDSKECEKRNLTFVVWNVVSGLDGNSFLSKLQQAENLGFTVTPWTSSFDWDAKEFLVDKAKELGYPIDGLVGRYDDIEYGTNLGATSHHSRAIFAFKFYDETYETQLKYIHYEPSRNGVLTPVAVFEPIDTGDSVIERASLHNLSVMEDLLGECVYAGQPLEIFKANQIIPQVKSAVKRDYGYVIAHGGVTVDGFGNDFGVPFCPICGELTQVIESDTGIKNLYCVNPNCDGKLINKLDHFCCKSGLDIKGLSKATLEKLIDWGWVGNIREIFSLDNFKTEWIKKPGFGPKSVENVLAAIENSKHCNLENFISALGIEGVGLNTAKDLVKEFKTWDDFIAAVNDKSYHFWKIDGFGPETDYALKHFDYTLAKEIANFMEFNQPEEKEQSQSLAGEVVCITGKLNRFKNRGLLEEAIAAAGGKVTGSVSKNTTYLINNDSTSESSKNITAKKLGVKIITEEDFVKIFNI